MTDSNLTYVRTDKNGTKIYQDWSCPRCGGAGSSSMWARTGEVCFACSGTGRRVTPRTVKEYAPEYAAKLEARRVAKLDAAVAPDAEQIWLLQHMQAHGFSADGITYLHSGKTYPVRGRLRSAGAKWIDRLQSWACPVRVEAQGITIAEIKWDAVYVGPMFDLAWGKTTSDIKSKGEAK